MTEVEKTLHQKESEINKKDSEIQAFKERVDDANKNIEDKTNKLEEATKLIEQNHSMISWLNKELSDAKKDRLKPPMLPGGGVPGRPGASGMFRPSNTDYLTQGSPYHMSPSFGTPHHVTMNRYTSPSRDILKQQPLNNLGNKENINNQSSEFNA